MNNSATLISEGADTCVVNNFNSMPIVLHLKDRGDCAVENIELFDEGRYGAGNLYFRGRFSTFKEVAQQINAILSLGCPLITPDKLVEEEVFKEENGELVFNENVTLYEDEENDISIKSGNVLALNRFYNPRPIQYFKEPDISDPYPQKASNPILFMIRIKFYGDFAYIWFGDKWKQTEDRLKTVCGHELNDGESYSLDELFVTKHCMISSVDALDIMKLIKKEGKTESTAMALNNSKNDNESFLTLDGGLITDGTNTLVV